MKEKAFTLTEMLGVITVLGLIALIVFPNVTKAIKSSKNKLYERQVDMIENNARRWGIDNINLLPSSGSYYLELMDLVKGGYITNKEIKDPRDNTVMNGCVIIDYSTKYDQYEYQYVETTCSENKPQYPTIVEKVESSSETMTNDPDGNRRYVGSNPNNYVSFNNELWRIIGTFNGQAKIIRNEPYSNDKAWDNDFFNGGHGDQGYNDWSIATLQIELNGTYLNSINSTYKSMIDQSHTWNLGGLAISLSDQTRANIYSNERGTTVYSGRPTTWTGAIGLMYLSDYGYSTSATDSECDETIDNWSGRGNVENCKNNSWLYNSSYYRWTLTPATGDECSAYPVAISGGTTDSLVCNTFESVPVLYLKPDVKITGGEGSESKPYTLSV